MYICFLFFDLTRAYYNCIINAVLLHALEHFHSIVQVPLLKYSIWNSSSFLYEQLCLNLLYVDNLCLNEKTHLVEEFRRETVGGGSAALWAEC